MQQSIQFVLVPDSSAARRLRRLLVTQAPRQGILVGTWPELVEHAESAYLLASRTSDWRQAFHGALERLPDAFWSRSFEVAQEETAAEVEAALSLLVSATQPGVDLDISNADQLPERPRKHVEDIVRLLGELDGALPDDLLAIQQLLAAESDAGIRRLVVCHIEGFPSLTRWQTALIHKLNADAGHDMGDEVREEVGDGVGHEAGDGVRDDKLNADAGHDVGDEVREEVGDGVGHEAGDGVRDDKLNADAGHDVGDKVRDEVREKAGNEAGDGVREEAGNEVGDGVRDEVRHEAGDQVGIKVGEEAGNEVRVEPAGEIISILQSLQCDSASGSPQTSLQSMQQHLFSAPEGKTALDDSVQWLGVRDFLAEVEVAAGMAQQMLRDDPELTPADIGLLVPDVFEYSLAVNEVFSAAGLPLSGLPVDHWQRDLGREALFHFLYCRQKPSPAMALAVCLSSPLMPWSKEQGAGLAQTVMNGEYRLQPFRYATQADQEMLGLLRGGDEDPATLSAAIQAFVNLLDAGEQFESHVYRARAMAEDLCATLTGAAAIDWIALRRLSSPQKISSGETPNFNLQGLTVWRESHEAWRPVRFLMVLGFASGHYPLASDESAVFVSDDLSALQKNMGLSLAMPADWMRERRARFKRQLAAVTDSVSFMIPRRDASGAPQSPSESLAFMQRLFDGIDDAESLILELDLESDRERARFLPAVQPLQYSPPREIAAEDIQFDLDLLALRKDAEGKQHPESPSSLETLMVSRLAWLLRRIEAEPLAWKPERLDVMLLGTLTHQVFEHLFQQSQPLPDAEDLGAGIESLLDSAIRQHAPFLRAAQWQVERRHLAFGINKAALVWREVLIALKAEVLGTEEWLKGDLHGVPIHGTADILLGLPGGQLLVVDYKRSSANSRRPRMQNGYDSQASLYGRMLQTGGLKSEENVPLRDRLRAAETAGIVYFMTNDQTSLSDTLVDDSGAIPGWEVLDGDVAHLAMNLITARLKEVGEGHLYLNREGDSEFFEKVAGMKPYALGNSALIPLFTLPGAARESESRESESRESESRESESRGSESRGSE